MLQYQVENKESARIPVIIVPGILQQIQDYQGLITDNPVVILDLRGQGKSLNPIIPPSNMPPDLTLLQLATDVFDVILACEFTEFILFGCDLGGSVCLQLSLLLRGRDDMNCKGLIVCNSMAKMPSRGLLMPMLQGAFNSSDYVSACLGSEWINANQDYHQSILASIKYTSTPFDIACCIQGLDVTDQLNLIKLPCLVIHGDG